MKKKGIFRHLTTLTLALVLVLCLLPLGANAEECTAHIMGDDGNCTACSKPLVASLTNGDTTTYYATAAEAFAAAQTTGRSTVTILANATFSGSNNTLDLSQVSLKVNPGAELELYMITLFIDDISGGGTIDGSGTYLNVNGTISDVAIQYCRITNYGTINSGAFNYEVSNHGTINGGTFGDVVNNRGTITGGTFNSTVYTYQINDREELEITGGTFNSWLFHGLGNYQGGTINADNLTLGENFSFSSSCDGAGINCTHKNSTPATCVAAQTCPFGCSGLAGIDETAHSLSYRAENNVITETCANGCTHSATATLAITESDITYNGQPHNDVASVTYSTDWKGSKELTVQYENNTNAGTATAYIEIGAAKATQNFTIDKATPKVEDFTITLPQNEVYDGTAKPATVTVKDGITGMGTVSIAYYKGEELLNETPIGAGTYTVDFTVTAGNNYYLARLLAGEFTIAKADCIYDAPVAQQNLVYNGQPQELTTAGTANGGYKVLYWFPGDEGYSENVLTATDVGTYTVKWFAGYDSDNYKLSLGEIEVTIAPATITVTPDSKTVTYGDEIDLTYTSEGGKLTEVPAFEGALAIDGTDAGTYEIKQGTLKLVDNDNFKAANYKIQVAPVNVIITQATNRWVTEPNVTDWAYGMEPNIPTADPYFGTLIREYRLQSGTDADYTEAVPTLPGEYFVRFRVEETASWTGLSQVEKLNISQAALTVTVKDQTVKLGQQIDQTAYTVAGLAEGDTADVTLKGSTDKVTTSGMIEAEIVIRNASGADVSGYYSIALSCGDLTVEPDTSKIDALTENNVTADNEADIKAVQAQIAAGGAAAQEEWKAVTERCEKLIEKIEAVEAKNHQLETAADTYDVNTVNYEKMDEVQALIEDVEAQLATDNLTESQKDALEEVLADLQAVEKRMEDSLQILATEEISDTLTVTPENVKAEQKEDIQKAIETIETALETYGSNYTEADKKELNEQLANLKDAQAVLEKVEAVGKTLTALPKTADPDDETALKAFTDAKAAYDALSDYEKSLVSKEAKQQLDGLYAALTDYKIIKGNGSKWVEDSDKTLSFTANGPYSKFTGLKVDGKKVNTKYYTAKAGSTVITLKASYLDTLSVGKHSVTVLYTDGETSGSFTVRSGKVPATGDESNILFWTLLLFGAASAAVLTVESKKRMR